MEFSNVVELIGGIALFLFGMKLMGDGLKKVAGNRLELILYRLSNTVFKGVLLGTGVTSVIQSSCATSVMVVGFVNSGMMKLKQAVSVILGAILGTSITGWVLCLHYLNGSSAISGILSPDTLTGAVAVAGIILYMFSKKQKSQRIGMILMGFAILMYGMSGMSGAVSSLGQTESFRNLLASLSHPLVGILIGAVVTAILQSASAAVGILQALAVTGTMRFEVALPLLMGIAIGASAPVLLSAVGANTEGKRTALVYPIATTISVAVCAGLFYAANAIFSFPFLSLGTDPFRIAFLNTVLRLTMVILLLPFTGVIGSLVSALVKENPKEAEDHGPVLEERFVTHPALAVEQSRDAIYEMAGKAEEALSTAFSLLTNFKDEGFDKVCRLEELGDRYEDALGTYLIKLTGHDMTPQQNRDVSVFLHTISDFERLSDHAKNLAENAKEIHEKNIHFSDEGDHELQVITAAVAEIVKLAVSVFVAEDRVLATRVEPLEEWIDQLSDELKLHHVDRLQQAKCTIDQGFVFNDILTNLERVSDHCSNLAVAIIELESDEFDTHKYLDLLKSRHTPEFESYFSEYQKKYSL